MPTGHQQSIPEQPHDEALCPQCQLAHNPQGHPGKAGVSGRGMNQGGWSATPTQLQANSTAASMGQLPGVTSRQGKAYTAGNASLLCFQHAQEYDHEKQPSLLTSAPVPACMHACIMSSMSDSRVIVAPPPLPSNPACHPVGSCLHVRNNVVNFLMACPGPTISPTLLFQTDPHPTAQDSDLDWGDFFFNLVSMCIVYAHFSEAAVAGESNAAVIFSMGIAAVDIVLLALRWLCYDHFVSHG